MVLVLLQLAIWHASLVLSAVLFELMMPLYFFNLDPPLKALLQYLVKRRALFADRLSLLLHLEGASVLLALNALDALLYFGPPALLLLLLFPFKFSPFF